ncbi:MAG: thioesterase family protein [Candidatus Tectomicrobia bacterium]|uniref:Thioesterase family protein n=1 Tax=Tectimicrobiota bacterium TaxID=2528274 RepID=A0A932HYU1_UNCTE|nr:thioesterase family protein [Candidatus Tectomicrobia bacterium]
MGYEDIPDGIEGTHSLIVADEHVPPHLRGTNAEVVSTPSLVLFMEIAAFRSIEPYLAPGFTSVGTVVELKHLAGTPKGMKLEVRSLLVERDRRRFVFVCEIFDEVEKVAEGRHERFAVPRERKNEKLAEKIAKVRGRA